MQDLGVYFVEEIEKSQDVDIPERLSNVSMSNVIANHEYQKISEKFIDYPLGADAKEDKISNEKVDIAKNCLCQRC